MRHDFTKVYWGHNFEARSGEGDTFSGWTISTPRVREGDELVWETNYGTAVIKVTESKPYFDPTDMTRFSGVIIERHLSEKVKAMIAAGEVDSPPWAVID